VTLQQGGVSAWYQKCTIAANNTKMKRRMHSIKKNVKETVQSGMGKTGEAVKSTVRRKGNDRPVYCWISESFLS